MDLKVFKSRRIKIKRFTTKIFFLLFLEKELSKFKIFFSF